MSVGLGSNEYLYKLAGGMNASIGAGQGSIPKFEKQGISQEDLDIFSAAKINGSENVRGTSFAGGIKESIQGAIQGASGIFSGMTERLAQYDKGQLNHPEQRTAEQGQKLWELC